jgi:erythromycin esterase-like protein
MARSGFHGSQPKGGAPAAVRTAALPFDAPGDLRPLLDLVGENRFTLLGEASHGTHEFYFERAEITKRLITEKGYNAVAVEADWPDAYRVNRYVRGVSTDASADAALSGFKRFPTWMWRNEVIVDFVEWLREYNRTQPPARKVGFYGIDLYSLFASMEAVLTYLDRVDPEAAKRARFRYSCFDHFGEDTQAYGYAASFGMSRTCEHEVVAQLVEITRRAAGDAAARDGRAEPEELFFAEQNARLVKNAEEYYRTMFRGGVSSWNLRDRHMVETVQALDAHLSRVAMDPRIAIWAHNSHLGDARATEMGQSGEWNVGQLMRERHAGETALIGFSTYSGTVTAASDWGGLAQRKTVRPGLPDSYEALFHDVPQERFLLRLRDDRELAAALEAPRLQRAIGVIYLPETERISHYFHARLAQQFDAVIHIDATRAIEPLERTAAWVTDEAPETYPTGI